MGSNPVYNDRKKKDRLNNLTEAPPNQIGDSADVHLLFEDYSVFRLHALHEYPTEYPLFRVIDTIVSWPHRGGISPTSPNM